MLQTTLRRLALEDGCLKIDRQLHLFSIGSDEGLEL